MAIKLNTIIKGITPEPPRILIYGTDGVGKSSWAADTPNAIFTCTEDRHSHLNVDRFPVCESFQDAIDNLLTLLKEDHTYKTHVTDSADWLEKLVHAQICEEHNEGTISANSKGSDLSFGRGYALAGQLFDRYLTGLEALRKQKKMMIVIVAHAEIKKFNDPMRESYDKYHPSLHETVRHMLQQWADCVFFADFKTYINIEKGAFGKTDTKGIGEGERIIYTEERPAFEAKNSYDLPAELAMPKDKPFSIFNKAYNAWLKINKKK